MWKHHAPHCGDNELLCRLRNLKRCPISDTKHEHLEQPDQGYVVNNSKTVKTNKQQQQQQNSRSVGRGRKPKYFLLFKYAPLVQNCLCFTFTLLFFFFFFLQREKYWLYQISIWHAVSHKGIDGEHCGISCNSNTPVENLFHFWQAF